MYDEQRDNVPSPFGGSLGTLWKAEKITWRWAAALGLLGAVLVGVITGFFGYASYGYQGMAAGAAPGAIVGWIIATLLFICFFQPLVSSVRR